MILLLNLSVNKTLDLFNCIILISLNMGNTQTTEVAHKLQNFGNKIKENYNENIAKPVNNSNLKVMLKG